MLAAAWFPTVTETVWPCVSLPPFVPFAFVSLCPNGHAVAQIRGAVRAVADMPACVCLSVDERIFPGSVKLPEP